MELMAEILQLFTALELEERLEMLELLKDFVADNNGGSSESDSDFIQA